MGARARTCAPGGGWGESGQHTNGDMHVGLRVRGVASEIWCDSLCSFTCSSTHVSMCLQQRGGRPAARSRDAPGRSERCHKETRRAWSSRPSEQRMRGVGVSRVPTRHMCAVTMAESRKRSRVLMPRGFPLGGCLHVRVSARKWRGYQALAVALGVIPGSEYPCDCLIPY